MVQRHSGLCANADKVADPPKSSLICLLAGCKAASVHPIVDSGVDPAIHLINGRPEVFRVQIQVRFLSDVVELTASNSSCLWDVVCWMHAGQVVLE